MNAETESDRHWMRQALAQAESVLYLTAPNPRVGCVIVRNDACLAEGATQRAGGPHAEVVALNALKTKGMDAAGATIYVTLEPCSHHGRTPPCADAIIAARPARVVVAMRDPNPQVAGQGIARLRAAGIQVDVGVCADEALALNPGFVARMLRGTPWLWMKLAASLDGRIALPNGQSQWITGPQARADGHHWRARSCVVLTGLGTIQADNARMTVREVTTPRPPIRAIVDSGFRVDESARIFDGGPVWIFTGAQNAEKAARLADRNVTVIELPLKDGRVDLLVMSQWMAGRGVNEVHLEAGATLSGAMLAADCADELLVYLAPVLLGPGLGMVELPALDALAEAQRFEFLDTRAIGPDVRLRAQHIERARALRQALSH